MLLDIGLLESGKISLLSTLMIQILLVPIGLMDPMDPMEMVSMDPMVLMVLMVQMVKDSLICPLLAWMN